MTEQNSIQYNTIAREYSKFQDERANRVYLYDPSFLAVAGDLEGKTILDLGCGDGRMSRLARLKDAKKVVGIDVSAEMIKLAQKKEAENPLRINYQVGRVGEIGKIGEFDQVWGTFLLHYAETKQELEAMARDVADNLKQGGKFVAFNQNPLCPFSPLSNKKYGSTIFPDGPLFEGQRIGVTIWDREKQGPTFYNRHWTIETYNQALKKAGLTDIKWIHPVVSPEGIERFGKDFWLAAYQYPTIKILGARK